MDLGIGIYARVIAGELNGMRGPAKTFTPVNLFDVRLEVDGRGELSLTGGHNAAVVLLRGNVLVNGSAMTGEAKVAVLSRTGEVITLEAKARSLLLILSGESVNEPVASYGPFVMNTEAEIQQAFADYRAGRMGHVS